MKKQVTLQIQAVLYGNSKESLRHSLLSLANAAKCAQADGILGAVTVLWGDASPAPLYSAEEIKVLSDELSRTLPAADVSLRYVFFNENTGYGKGHNRLFSMASSDFVLILNPDVIVCHDFFSEMLAPFADETVGLTEARQTPVEHPKVYDPQTGEVEWASGACFIMPSALFGELGGFDDQSFFMYCEDVDLSFRLTQAEKRMIYRPTAPIYHSKSFDNRDGSLERTKTEMRYSVESQMILAYKWRFSSMLSVLKSVCKTGNEYQQAALASFEERLKNGELTRVEENTAHLKKRISNARFTM